MEFFSARSLNECRRSFYTRMSPIVLHSVVTLKNNLHSVVTLCCYTPRSIQSTLLLRGNCISDRQAFHVAADRPRSSTAVSVMCVATSFLNFLQFPSLNEPCASYHGMNFNNVFGPTGPFGCNMAFIVHARVVALRDLGGCQNPFGSFQLMQGLETLALRGRAHCENANILAQWLKDHDKVAWVSHPSLKDHPSHENAKK